MPEFLGDQLARAMADSMGDRVASDAEDLAVVGDAPNDDVGVGMARVVVIDRDPVELGVEVLLYLPHEVAGEAAQIAQSCGVPGRDDEAELVAVLPPGSIPSAGHGPKMRGTASKAADANLRYDPGLDNDPPRPDPPGGTRSPPVAVLGNDKLGAPAAGVETPDPRPNRPGWGSCPPYGPQPPAWRTA
jgi:hypothetical protein